MKHRREKIALVLIGGLGGVLLSGCKTAAESANSVRSFAPSSEIALETPPPASPPVVSSLDGSDEAASKSMESDAGSENHAENSDVSNNTTYNLSSTQVDYIQLLAQYIHQPIAGPEELLENPHCIAFLLDNAWITGRQDGSLTESEEPGKYGQVLVPIARLNSLSLQLFGVECDTAYIESLYTLSENDEIVYYPSDRPFFATEITDYTWSESTLQAVVETVAGGEGGASQYSEVFTYNFTTLPDGNLRLLSIDATQ